MGEKETKLFWVQIFGEDGQEIMDYRTTIEAKDWTDADIKAAEYEHQCYQENSFVDWYEVDLYP